MLKASSTVLLVVLVAAPTRVKARPPRPAAKTTALLCVERVNVSEVRGRALRAELRRALSKRPQLKLLDDAQVLPKLLAEPKGCETRGPCRRRLAAKLGSDRLLTFRAGRLGQTLMLRLTLYDRDGMKRGSWQEVLAKTGDKAEVASAALRRLVDGFAPQPRPLTLAPPWYKRWWLWAAVGAVVAGTATTAVLLSRRSTPSADHHIPLP